MTCAIAKATTVREAHATRAPAVPRMTVRVVRPIRDPVADAMRAPAAGNTTDLEGPHIRVPAARAMTVPVGLPMMAPGDPPILGPAGVAITVPVVRAIQAPVALAKTVPQFVGSESLRFSRVAPNYLLKATGPIGPAP